MPSPINIKNITIIAHVDHGKTTLVDALLKQSNTFSGRDDPGELIMDSNPLEREKGITILAKNASITYHGIKINIIDTPGHADFSGEVERVMNMADGCILLVDSVDGTMPQTRYVLQQALKYGLIPIVVINKMDRSERRETEVLAEIDDLFLDLVTDDNQLDYPVLYASAKEGYAVLDPNDEPEGIFPLLEKILEKVPSPTGSATDPLQILVTNLDYSDYEGQICIGKISRGTVNPKKRVTLISGNESRSDHTLENVYVYEGMGRIKAKEAFVGEIVALTGLSGVSIGDTLCDQDHPESLPPIDVEEPTVKMTFGVNTSPLMGTEAMHGTSRELFRRLTLELRTNVGLRLEETENPDQFNVSGRGELHLSILAETMRREGYEFQVSQAKPVLRKIDSKVHEPFENLFIETSSEHFGIISESMSQRMGVLEDVVNDGTGTIRMKFVIPTRGLIGFRSFFQNATHGDGVINSTYSHYQEMKGDIRRSAQGFLVASEPGESVAYGLINAQERGKTIISSGIRVYEGMIVGINSRSNDLVVNVCKEKKLTNMRSSTADISTQLVRPLEFSLEEALDLISEDELIEITPENLRLRKRVLDGKARHREERNSRKK